MFFRAILIVTMALICAGALFLLAERRSGDVEVKLRIGGINISTFRWSLILCAAGSLWLSILLTYPTVDIWCGVSVCLLFLCASAVAFLGGHGEILEKDFGTNSARPTIIVGFRVASDREPINYIVVDDDDIFDDEYDESWDNISNETGIDTTNICFEGNSVNTVVKEENNK